MKHLLSVVTLLILVAGCTKPVNTVERAEPLGQPRVVDDRRIVTDKYLGDRLAVRRVIESTVSGNLLKIQVDLQNESRDRLTFNYRFEWYDLDGMQVQTPTSVWRPKTLLGKESTAVAAVAPNPRAKDFVLKLVRPQH